MFRAITLLVASATIVLGQSEYDGLKQIESTTDSIKLPPSTTLQVYDVIAIPYIDDQNTLSSFFNATADDEVEAFVVVQSDTMTTFSSDLHEFDMPPGIEFYLGNTFTLPEGKLTALTVRHSTGDDGSAFLETPIGKLMFAVLDADPAITNTFAEGLMPTTNPELI